MKLTKDVLIKYRDLWTGADARNNVSKEVIARNHDIVSDFIECTFTRMLLNDVSTEEVKSIADWSKEIHENAVKHGFCEQERNVGEVIALMHSELSEALEEYRGKKVATLTEVYWGTGAKPEGFAVELADCVIRIMQYCEEVGISLEAMIELKHKYNLTRPYRHGGKLA